MKMNTGLYGHGARFADYLNAWSAGAGALLCLTQLQLGLDSPVVAAGRGPCSPAKHRPLRCEVWNGTRGYCSGGIHGDLASGSDVIRTLALCHWPDDPFDPFQLPDFPALRRLTVSHSNVTELAHDFPYDDHLEELILCGLHLTWLSDSAFTGLRRLRLLDLTRNQLTFLSPATLLTPPSLQLVHLAVNPWRCTLALSWMTDPPVHRLLQDQERMMCGAGLYPRKPVITVVHLLKRVAAECPTPAPAPAHFRHGAHPTAHPPPTAGPKTKCACELTRLVRDAVSDADDVALVPIISVNCSARGLDEMPAHIPGNTTTLLLRGNKIRSVRPLLDRYRDVLDVYLDDNQVESIDDLEGSQWLANFRVLSLRANRLQQLPTYALDNALERNNHAVRVYLGRNPWRCDCLFMPVFQELLAKYKTLIADEDDIRCADVEGDDNSLKKITSLSRSSVCRDERSGNLVAPIDLVNAILGSSLFVVLAKLAYDYWQYKHFGKLPWIATKLP